MHPKRSVALSEAGSPKLGRRATSLRHYKDRLIPRQFEGLEIGLDHFPSKWIPVRRRKCDQTMNLDHKIDE